MTVSLIIRAYKSTRENGYCESRILQILLFQFDSGRGLHKILFKIVTILDKISVLIILTIKLLKN